jgi:hypothetical protein
LSDDRGKKNNTQSANKAKKSKDFSHKKEKNSASSVA